jgi:hypothetical protein
MFAAQFLQALGILVVRRERHDFVSMLRKRFD